ncbi:hypothetical protein RV18_GL000792 [Enterococcus termitis]|nr:hypothetical protein RV18_GL000792 [Enterococcus termitis]
MVLGLAKGTVDLISSLSLKEDFNTTELIEVYEQLQEADFFETGDTDVKKVSNSQVVTAYLHLTNKCNLHCVGCYSFDDKRNVAPDMTTDEIYLALDQLEEVGITNLVFSGGEPLLRNDIVAIAKYAKEKCSISNIVMITNGTVFNEAKILEISNFIDSVSVSLDTYSAECPSFIRDEGIFSRIMRTVDFFKTTKVKVTILPTLHHGNMSDIHKYIELSDKTGVEISFSLLSGCAEGELKDYLPTELDIQSLSRYVLAGAVSLDDTQIGSNCLTAQDYCGAGESLIAIGTEGNLYPCHMLMDDQLSLGNIRDGRISEYLSRKSERNAFLGNISVDSIEGGCQQCEARYLCGGGCRARASYASDVRDRDPYCSLFKDYYMSVLEMIT